MRKIIGNSRIPKEFPLTLDQRKSMARAFGGIDAKLFQIVHDFNSLNLYYPCIAKAGGSQQVEDIVNGGICTNIHWVSDPSQGMYTLKQMEERIGCSLHLFHFFNPQNKQNYGNNTDHQLPRHP